MTSGLLSGVRWTRTGDSDKNMGRDRGSGKRGGREWVTRRGLGMASVPAPVAVGDVQTCLDWTGRRPTVGDASSIRDRGGGHREEGMSGPGGLCWQRDRVRVGTVIGRSRR